MKTEFVCIGLTNPKSTSNVGSVMRAAGCYEVDQVLYTGRRYDRAAKLTTDTKKVRIDIPLQNVDSLGHDCLTKSVDDDTKIVCVDLVKGATPLPAFVHPEKAIYIFGPEDNTISQEVIDKADHVVFVPTVGCMNLAASVNVLLYDRLAKSNKADAGDELILKSRDRNNNVKVKGLSHNRK
ncbi:RNA methyltransferase [Marinomonas sp. PE14-40]|uniref:RNA methyltransferase n=1 Tax=Marinomonas sp. PE14-40 TaxID=3060621 RepID=UPI003F672C92